MKSAQFATGCKSYKNGDGCYFRFYLKDVSGDIKVIGHNGVCEKLLSLININNYNELSGAQIQDKNLSYVNHTNSKYEIVLNINTLIE